MEHKTRSPRTFDEEHFTAGARGQDEPNNEISNAPRIGIGDPSLRYLPSGWPLSRHYSGTRSANAKNATIDQSGHNSTVYVTLRWNFARDLTQPRSMAVSLTSIVSA